MRNDSSQETFNQTCSARWHQFQAAGKWLFVNWC